MRHPLHSYSIAQWTLSKFAQLSVPGMHVTTRANASISNSRSHQYYNRPPHRPNMASSRASSQTRYSLRSSQNSLRHYTYRPLAPEDTIRLLRLHPGTDSDAPLRCTLFETSLVGAPSYVALSPTHGGARHPDSLYKLSQARQVSWTQPSPSRHHFSMHCSGYVKLMKTSHFGSMQFVLIKKMCQREINKQLI
jgi:hypothetical protein